MLSAMQCLSVLMERPEENKKHWPFSRKCLMLVSGDHFSFVVIVFPNFMNFFLRLIDMLSI